MSIFDLTGKKAIVTGGSRGLGHGMAEGLMEAGCEVVIIGTRESIKDRAAEFNQKGLKCTGVQADLGDEIASFSGISGSTWRASGHFGNGPWCAEQTSIGRISDGGLEKSAGCESDCSI